MSTGAGQMAVIASTMGVGGTGRRVISQVPPEYLAEVLARKVYIFNISDRTFGPIARTHSNITIPSRGSSVYSVTPITARVEYPDAGIEAPHGSVTVNQQITTAKQIAEDLCAWCNGDLPRCDASPDVPVFVGVWWEESPEPTQLKAMVDRKRAYNKALVMQADMLADTEAGRRNINDMMRSAARELGLRKTWLYEATEMAACPACGSPVLPDTAICRTCNAVLNEAKARQFFPERFLHKGGSGDAFVSDQNRSSER